MKGRRPKAFLDTNVWISAYVFTGNEKRIVEMAIKGDFNSIISDQVINEFIRIMQGKFKLSKRSVFNAVTEIIQISEIVKFNDTMSIKLIDNNDQAIVNAALFSECDFLVTGDKKILGLGQIKKTRIIKPKEFLDILNMNLKK